MPQSEDVIIRQTPNRKRFNELSLTKASRAMINMKNMINMKTANKDEKGSERYNTLKTYFDELTGQSDQNLKEKQITDQGHIEYFIRYIKKEKLLGLKMEDYIFLLKHPNACSVIELILRNSRGATQLSDAVQFCRSLDEHESEKLVMVHDDAASVKIPYTKFRIRARDLFFLNLFWDLFCDSAPTMEQIRSTVETVGLLGALSLSVAIGFPTSFDYEELYEAKLRFAGCEEDVVDDFGVTTYRCFLFNAASVASSIIIIFVSCATDLDDPVKLRRWWMWVRFCVMIAMAQCFLGSYFAFNCFWMMIRLKWPANKPNESYLTGECNAPPPLLDTTEVWMGNYWFSKILMFSTFLLVGGMMSMCVMREVGGDDDDDENTNNDDIIKNKVQPEIINNNNDYDNNNYKSINKTFSNNSMYSTYSTNNTPISSNNNSNNTNSSGMPIDMENHGSHSIMRSPDHVVNT